MLSKNKPDDEKEGKVPFCSYECRREYLCRPVCPKCGAHEKHLLAKKEGESIWPNPEALVEMGKQSEAIARLRAQVHQLEQKLGEGSDAKEKIQERTEQRLKVFEQMDRESTLPIRVCRECKDECEPQSPYSLYVVYYASIPRLERFFHGSVVSDAQNS